jgi:TDG/mug DNA glycosylase family protein
MTRLVGLPPLVADNTRLLILGSFPGAASLAAQQYYGHPQNKFWRILAALYGANAEDICASSYEKRSTWMLSKGVGLWDVYASCERVGSLDAKIRNAEVNDFAALRLRCPALQAVAHNGAESFRHAAQIQSLGLPVLKLPSTSPANASWSFERKLAAWRDGFEQFGMDI